jgi:hypothetical protein
MAFPENGEKNGQFTGQWLVSAAGSGTAELK